uniref:Uncharacterized protein n=1 Tax=Oryza punctata TaxID=4537 RepID=A0A0E0L757_ORYPU
MGMEDDAAGRGTTVPFLVAVRFVVAFAVGAAAFAVIVMVIAVVSRPEEIQLSVDRGYITVLEDPEYRMAVSMPKSSATETTINNPITIDPGPGDSYDYPPPETAPGPSVQELVQLAVSLTASYSSRRGHQYAINCTNITVGLVDMTLSPSSWASGQLPEEIKDTIVRFRIHNDFMLYKETSHTEARTVAITDKGQYNNITNRLYEEDVFQVLVMVHIVTHPPNSPSPPPPSPPPSPSPSPSPSPPPPPPPPPHHHHQQQQQHTNNGAGYTFYCWPITVGYGYKNLQATDDVDCKRIGSSEVPGRHDWYPAPPAPPPPPPPGRT